MCSRVTLRSPLDRLQSIFGFNTALEHSPRYNIAPTQQLLTLSANSEGSSFEVQRAKNGPALYSTQAEKAGSEATMDVFDSHSPESPQTSSGNRRISETQTASRTSAERQARWMSWGFRGHPLGSGKRQLVINARSESVHELKLFREAFAKRRCLVLVDGFYEWRQEGRIKQPYLFEMSSDEPFAMAAIFEEDHGDEARCTILTTEANSTLEGIHDRMPVILSPSNLTLWLEPEAGEAELREILKPYPGSLMKKRKVSLKINSSRKDSPELLGPPEQGSLF